MISQSQLKTGILRHLLFLHCKGVPMDDYIIEMLNITKEFPGIIANDNITLQLKKGEIHALLGATLADLAEEFRRKNPPDYSI